MKERLVPDVHPEHDVRLPSVPAKSSLTDENPESEARVECAEGRQRRMFHKNHYGETNPGPWCFTVMIPVKHRVGYNR
jgi:hypothetical protein